MAYYVNWEKKLFNMSSCIFSSRELQKIHNDILLNNWENTEINYSTYAFETRADVNFDDNTSTAKWKRMAATAPYWYISVGKIYIHVSFVRLNYPSIYPSNNKRKSSICNSGVLKTFDGRRKKKFKRFNVCSASHCDLYFINIRYFY